jgi:ABC-type branched-subunit amino acid transport system substrate-binding protein
MISPSSTNPNITEGGFDVGYRVVGRDDVQGQVAEQFARETLGVESVYIIHDQTDYGQGIAEFFRQFAEENDIEVLGFEGTQEQSVFDSILTPIQAANPDLIYFGGVYSQAGPFFRQARDRGIQSQFMGPDGMDNAELLDLAGDAVDGMYYSSVAAPVSQFPDAADYASAYEEAYGEAAPPFSAQAYDAAGVCIQAIANAAEEVGGLPTREDVVAAIDSLEGYEGITSDYTFNEKGDPTEATYFILQANVENWNENELVERLTVAAPGSEEGDIEETIDEEVPEEAPTEEGAGEEGASEEEGAVEEAPAELEVVGSNETIKIATQSPLSGPQAAIGVGLRNAAELGIDDMGQSLVDQGFIVELEPFDDEAQPERGVANANNAVADSDILCMVGHYNSGVALAALPVYTEADLVMMSPANTNPNITEGGFDVAFRIVGRDDVQGVVGSQFARETLGAQSVYIIHDQTDYGQGIAQVFREDAEANGAQVLGFEGTQETSVFDSILTPIQAANPDVIYFGGIFSQAGPFFRQARERGIQAEFMGPDGLDNAELANLGGDAVAGMHYTSVAAPVSQFPDAADFAAAYEETFGDPAPPFSAQAYDSTGLCIQAISNAAQEVGGLPTRADVLAAMEDLGVYEGITGTYEFNDKGDPVEAVYYVLQANVDDWNANELADRLVIAPPEE